MSNADLAAALLTSKSMKVERLENELKALRAELADISQERDRFARENINYKTALEAQELAEQATKFTEKNAYKFFMPDSPEFNFSKQVEVQAQNEALFNMLYNKYFIPNMHKKPATKPLGLSYTDADIAYNRNIRKAQNADYTRIGAPKE